MSINCRFCEINKDVAFPIENRPILTSENFFSIASIGALVEGWVLITPKTHICSMKNIYNEAEFADFTGQILKRLINCYDSKIIAFEHGPNKIGSDTSCGTNHAHLHLVPYKGSLLSAMSENGMKWEKCRFSQIESIVRDNEYLFYCELPEGSKWNDAMGYIHILKKPVSQYFRKLIAKELHCDEKFDYKIYQEIDVTIRTQQLLSKVA